MRSLIITLVSLLTFAVCYGQERSKTTIPFKDGNLTFEYYEKDGIKVPDGWMVFSAENYIEKGYNKDGYMEDEWYMEVYCPYNKQTERRIMVYKNGLLDGKSKFTWYQKNENGEEVKLDTQILNFKDGHLYGDNVLKYEGYTLWCKHDENGKKIGEWKVQKDDNPDSLMMGLFTEDSNIICKEAYRLDVLGQKVECSKFEFDMMCSAPQHLVSILLTWRPYDTADRIVLPTLSKTPYGYKK